MSRLTKKRNVADNRQVIDILPEILLHRVSRSKCITRPRVTLMLLSGTMETITLDQFDGQLIDGLEFCSRAYALFENIRDREDGPSRLRMRESPLEKKLLEELLPICKYVQASYRIGRYISIRWVNGNQTYDAEITQRGAYVSDNYYPSTGHIEVTCTMHLNEYLSRELLETKGGCFGLEGIRRLKNREIESIPVGFTNKEFIAPYSELVLNQIAKKAQMPYPENTILIVQCTMNTMYTHDEWDTFIVQVKEKLPTNSFSEIYLYDNVCQHSQFLYPSNVPNKAIQKRR